MVAKNCIAFLFPCGSLSSPDNRKHWNEKARRKEERTTFSLFTFLFSLQWEVQESLFSIFHGGGLFFQFLGDLQKFSSLLGQQAMHLRGRQPTTTVGLMSILWGPSSNFYSSLAPVAAGAFCSSSCYPLDFLFISISN